MKRNLSRVAIALTILFIAIQLIPVDRTNSPITREVKWDSPQTKELARKACLDCHSNETSWPWDGYIAPASWLIANHIVEGRSRLNFSEWDKPNANLEEVTRSIQEGSMPIQSYVLMHPSAKLTQSERDALIAGLTATMQQDPPIPQQRRRRER